MRGRAKFNYKVEDQARKPKNPAPRGEEDKLEDAFLTLSEGYTKPEIIEPEVVSDANNNIVKRKKRLKFNKNHLIKARKVRVKPIDPVFTKLTEDFNDLAKSRELYIPEKVKEKKGILKLKKGGIAKPRELLKDIKDKVAENDSIEPILSKLARQYQALSDDSPISEDIDPIISDDVNDSEEFPFSDDTMPPYENEELDTGLNESFNENLAETLDENTLKKISGYLLESIENDVKASENWMKTIERVKEFIGFDIEDTKNIPFKESTRTYDTTLANCLIRLYSLVTGEFFHPNGPASYKINGPYKEDLEDKGDRVRDLYNYYLTSIDKGYYDDCGKFMLRLLFEGSGFKKVYYDKRLKFPVCRFMRNSDFIIDADCTSIMDSIRLTHILHLSKREILLKQKNGEYRDIELKYLKTSEIPNDLNDITQIKDKDVDLNAYDKRSTFPIYECHVYLDLDEFIDNNSNTEPGIPLPFIVILDPNSKEILSIRRNWEEDDIYKERINYFIHYNCLDGFGLRGLGLAHLIGSNAISLTTITRELVDAGKFKNLPAGFRKKGIKQQENNLIIGPGQFVEVDTGGEPLEGTFMPLPYSEPSQALRELRNEIMQQTKELGSASELGMLQSKEDIPTGTALAFLETNNRIQSTILKSIYYSFKQELQLIDKIFRKTMDFDFTEVINGVEINAGDFVDEIIVIPVADPSSNSSIHKLMRAQTILQLAMQAPELHNMREVYKFNYKSQGLSDEEIEKILLPVPPPLSEAEINAQMENQQPTVDPNALLMADIRQKEEENIIKERIANLKAETDVFKAQLDFEKSKAKLESEEDIATLRAEVELSKQPEI